MGAFLSMGNDSRLSMNLKDCAGRERGPSHFWIAGPVGARRVRAENVSGTMCCNVSPPIPPFPRRPPATAIEKGFETSGNSNGFPLNVQSLFLNMVHPFWSGCLNWLEERPQISIPQRGERIPQRGQTFFHSEGSIFLSEGRVFHSKGRGFSTARGGKIHSEGSKIHNEGSKIHSGGKPGQMMLDSGGQDLPE
jgi:hypothetical protein